MIIDLTKPVQTADGRAVRVICTDRGGTYSVVVLVAREDGREGIYCYDLLGRHKSDRDLDLINIDTTPKNLLIAREAMARMLDDQGFTEFAQDCRKGERDSASPVKAALIALEMVA